MHPISRARRTRSAAPPWFGAILTWTTPPARRRYRFPRRVTHYAGRTYELIKFTQEDAQQLDLGTGGWHFTRHPHRVSISGLGFGPALGPDLACAFMLAEAWLLSEPVDVVARPDEPMPDLLLALAGAGPTFHVRGEVMMLWPRPEHGCVGLHRYTKHLTERGPELGVLEPQFDLTEFAGAERHGLRWRPRLSPYLGGEYLEASMYWREALSTLAHNVERRLPR